MLHYTILFSIPLLFHFFIFVQSPRCFVSGRQAKSEHTLVVIGMLRNGFPMYEAYLLSLYLI